MSISLYGAIGCVLHDAKIGSQILHMYQFITCGQALTLYVQR